MFFIAKKQGHFVQKAAASDKRYLSPQRSNVDTYDIYDVIVFVDSGVNMQRRLQTLNCEPDIARYTPSSVNTGRTITARTVTITLLPTRLLPPVTKCDKI